MAVFPDCDPDYLYEQLEARKYDPDRLAHISSEMLGKRKGQKNYPKLAEKKSVRTESSLLAELGSVADDRLDGRDFYATGAAVSNAYSDYCYAVLCNRFPRVPVSFVRQIMSRFKDHFVPSLRALSVVTNEIDRQRTRAKRAFQLLKTPRDPMSLPTAYNAEFALDLYFTGVEATWQAERDARQAAKEKRLKEAQEAGAMLECGCCFGDFLAEDTAQCPTGHLFCLECCRLAANEEIGKGRLSFRCLSTDRCTFEFSEAETRRFLPKTVFERHLQRKQLEELKQANVDGLVGCPFCNYAAVMPDDDKVFKCLNPECMKESCRMCQEENHVPLRCDEVETRSEKAMRTYIENEMTNALLRTCKRCRRRFYKTEGCSHMTCVCGAQICYICGEMLTGNWYAHWRDGTCRGELFGRQSLNESNVRRGAQEAVRRYLDEHPEAAANRITVHGLTIARKKTKKPATKKQRR